MILADIESTATAVAIVLGAVGVLAAQVGALIIAVRNRGTLQGVQAAVNGHAHEQAARIQQLVATIERSDLEVPPTTRSTGQ